MRTLIIYYSYTGNNAVLAEQVAARLRADTFRLAETKERALKQIILDMVFHRNAAVQAVPEQVKQYDLVLFMGPVWMFHICSPLMTCMKAIRKQVGRYAFVALSGGALGPNTKPVGELKKVLGRDLALFLDLHIAQYCRVPESAKADETSTYSLKEHPDDLERLVGIILPAIQGLDRPTAGLQVTDWVS